MKNPGLLILSAIVFGSTAATAAIAQTHIESIYTALNHFSVIQLPAGATVDNVAVGCAPSEVQVQWSDRNVLVKPLKPGIRTNLAIFTHSGQVYNYEILPAGDPAEMSMVIREYDAAAAQRQNELATETMRNQTDTRNAQFLMSAEPIDNKAVRRMKRGVNVKLTLVGQSADSYYVRFRVVNSGDHEYRLQAPRVQKIDPAFGIDMAYSHVDCQLSAREFRKFRSFQQTDVVVHNATITKQDLIPDTATDFVMAIQKPAVTPAIFRFLFPSDDGTEVSAVAIF